MKTIVYLLATVCACNATFLNLFRGGIGGDSHNVKTSYHIMDHDHNDIHDHAHSHSHDHGHYNSYSQSGSPQIIKVIITQGGRGALASSNSYAYASGPQGFTGYGNGNFAAASQVRSTTLSSGYGSGIDSLYGILPQILQLILQGDVSNINPQLTNHYGKDGSAFVRRIYGKNDYAGGHVIQSGTLEVMEVKETHDDHPPHDHGW